MKRKDRQPEVGKWFFSIRYIKYDLYRYDPWARSLKIFCMKLHTPIPELVSFSPDYYKGFIFNFRFRIPFYVEQWR